MSKWCSDVSHRCLAVAFVRLAPRCGKIKPCTANGSKGHFETWARHCVRRSICLLPPVADIALEILRLRLRHQCLCTAFDLAAVDVAFRARRGQVQVRVGTETLDKEWVDAV